MKAAETIDNMMLVIDKKRAGFHQPSERLRHYFEMVQRNSQTGVWEVNFFFDFSSGCYFLSQSAFYFSDEIYKIVGLCVSAPELSPEMLIRQLLPGLWDFVAGYIERRLAVTAIESEYQFNGFDGRQKNVIANAELIVGRAHLSPIKLVGTLRDITENIGAGCDARLVHSNSAASSEKEHELSLKIDELSSANASLENFVSIISHDLRAPLLSMQGILNLIEAENDQHYFAEDLGYLSQCVSKLDKYIIDLLDYSRCSRSQTVKELVDLEVMVGEIIQQIRYMKGHDSQIQIRKQVSEDAKFYSDPKLVYIILSNLISNAIRYSNPSSKNPYVEITVVTSSENCRMWVVDNGIGISEENLGKIFDIFYRVSHTTKGTGLGLHLVKTAVEKLSGTVSVESFESKGTVFSVTIPNMNN